MTSKTIEIIVSPNGQTRLETKGFHGNECQQASRLIESALGQRTDEQLTAEFFQAAQTDERQHEQH